MTSFPIDWTGAVRRAAAHSGFLAQGLRDFPVIAERLGCGAPDEAWAAIDDLCPADMAVSRRLRIARRARALTIAVADLAGAWHLDEVTARLSDFADHAIDEAVAEAFRERYPDEPVRGLAVIGLGKLGSRELNYSSDIDLILLFDPATLPHGDRETPGEAALRLSRRVVALLSERDANGYVFRVDLRLRPSPEATPIVLPVEHAIGYYESLALGWEQAAFIRARAVGGDIALGDAFLRAIRPFVWRRSLDFSAVDAILDISRRIRDHYASSQAFGPGYDLKRGRGGIREVEFFAQVHQLIHGGRNPDLRSGATRKALAALATAGIIDTDVAGRLDEAYVLLRTIEHRLQMIDDRQTHELPAGDGALGEVARLHGLADGGALLDLLRPHVVWVGANYDRLSPFEHGERLSRDVAKLADQLDGIGFPDAPTAAARIDKWRNGSVRALRSAAAVEAFERLMPELFRGLARAPEPMIALNRFESLIERLPTAINFFKLLNAHKAVLRLLVDVLCYAPSLADSLSTRVDLLDSLIGNSALEPLPDVPSLIAQLARGEAGDDYQLLLDGVRQKVGDRRFSLGVQVISKVGDAIEIGRGYARLAEAAIEVLTRATIDEFESAHGRVPGGELTILALGRLGGGLLTHASDLDLVFLFSGAFGVESDGPKPLGATQYFNRLAQRVTNALSVRTASGPLYEVDTRLRPSGSQGLLAVNFDSFRRYQHEAAWAWEHLALTRARPIFGSAAARDELGAIISDVLLAERDGDALAEAAVAMRADIARHKKPGGDLDVKLAPGGLIDLEFLVHVNQFRHRAAFVPDLGEAIDRLVGEGILAPDLRAAHDLLTRYLVVSRLVAPGADAPAPEAQALVARVCGADNWSDMLVRIADARHSIGTAWAAVADRFGGNRHA